MTDTTRRRLIASIGSGLTIGVAGCSRNSTGGEANTSSGSNDGDGGGLLGSEPKVFDGFTFEKYTLNISLATTEGYDRIVAFGESGKQFASTSVTPSAEVVSLDFTDYSPGEYRFAAVASGDESVISETTQVLEPNIELVGWKTASETDEYTQENWVGVVDPVINVANTGNAPGNLTWIGFESEEFTPEWAKDGDPKSVAAPKYLSPEVQVKRLSEEGRPEYMPDFESDKNLPITVYSGDQMQLIDTNNRRPLTAGMEPDRTLVNNWDDKGWQVQEGSEYEFTITVGTQYSGRSSVTKTVIWENIKTAESLADQPNDALVATKDPNKPE